MSAHILLEDMPISVANNIQVQVSELLAHHYKIRHATLQVECAGCDPDSLYCDIEALHSHEYSK